MPLEVRLWGRPRHVQYQEWCGITHALALRKMAPILGGTFIQRASQIFPLLSSTHTAGCSSQKFTYQELVPFVHLSKKLIKRLVRAKYQARLQERLKDE